MTFAQPLKSRPWSVGTVTASRKVLTLQSTFDLSQCLRSKRGAAWAEERLLGALRQSVPQNGRVHLHIIDVSGTVPTVRGTMALLIAENAFDCNGSPYGSNCRARAELLRRAAKYRTPACVIYNVGFELPHRESISSAFSVVLEWTLSRLRVATWNRLKIGSKTTEKPLEIDSLWGGGSLVGWWVGGGRPLQQKPASHYA